MIGRRQRGDDAVVETHPVLLRARQLVVVGEGQRPLGAVGLRHAALQRRHDLEGLAVAHPRAGLVAQRQRLQARPVGRVVLLVPVVEPGQRAGIGHRRPEIEAMRHRGGREVVAAREGAVSLRAARGQHPVGGRAALGLRKLAQRDIVDPAARGLAGAGLQLQLDRDDALAAQRRHIAQPHRLACPLLRIQRLRLALRLGPQREAMLIARRRGGHARAIVQHRIQRDIGGGHRVAVDDLRQHQPRQRGVRPDDRIDLEQGRAPAAAAIAQRPDTAVTRIGLCGVRHLRPAADPQLRPAACRGDRSGLARLERCREPRLRRRADRKPQRRRDGQRQQTLASGVSRRTTKRGRGRRGRWVHVNLDRLKSTRSCVKRAPPAIRTAAKPRLHPLPFAKGEGELEIAASD